MSSECVAFYPALKYRDANESCETKLPTLANEETVAQPAVVVTGVPEEDVERRVAAARDTAASETERRLRAEFEERQQATQAKMTEALASFTEERARYFQRVEVEVVHLALAIARKILQREAELDPTLLAALVRIALDRMQSGSSVRVRVAAEEVNRWRECAITDGSAPKWDVIADANLRPGDCIVETEMGKANFGFEAQLRDIEQSFSQLMAHRPERV